MNCPQNYSISCPQNDSICLIVQRYFLSHGLLGIWKDTVIVRTLWGHCEDTRYCYSGDIRDTFYLSLIITTMNVVPAGFLITLFDSEFSCLFSYCSFMQYNFAWSIFGNMYMMMFFNFEQLADASLYCQNNLILSFLYEVGFIIWITCSSFL